jgi:p-aminobenzoyl-glutamate transporter AbgT
MPPGHVPGELLTAIVIRSWPPVLAAVASGGTFTVRIIALSGAVAARATVQVLNPLLAMLLSHVGRRALVAAVAGVDLEVGRRRMTVTDDRKHESGVRSSAARALT